ncbi:MAG: methyltransferase domain-containing protein [Pseudomonadota bacterium]
MKDLDFLQQILCCPSCYGKLKKQESSLICLGCEQIFSIQNGVPVILNKESLCMLEAGKDQVLPRNIGRLGSFLRKVLPQPLEHRWITSKENKERAFHFLSKFNPSSLVLDLGSGIKRWSDNVVNLDIGAFENVDIVGDGHKLPFCDEEFDGVISCVVLEHVNNPYKVTEEMHQFLKKGGQIFVSFPFIYAFHSSTGTHQDFTRLTKYGLQEIFFSFEKIELRQEGVVSISIISILSAYLVLLFTDRDVFYGGLQRFFGWLLFPLCLLDPILAKRSKVHMIAPSFFFIGRK